MHKPLLYPFLPHSRQPLTPFYKRAERKFHTAEYLTKYFNHWLFGRTLKPMLTDTQLSGRTTAIIYIIQVKNEIQQPVLPEIPQSRRGGG